MRLIPIEVGCNACARRGPSPYVVVWLAGILSALPAFSQKVSSSAIPLRETRSDTIETPKNAKILNLTLELPEGEVFIESSKACGWSQTHFFTPVPGAFFTHADHPLGQGLTDRHIFLAASVAENMSKSPLPGENSMLPPLLTGDFRPYTLNYRHDPSVDTRLTIRQEKGGLLLEPGSLHLRQLNVHSAFANVNLQYQSPNQTRMEGLTVHVARGALVVKNLELARAARVTLQNDMGDTRIWLGNGLHSLSEVRIRSGAGNVTLYIDERHPVEIRVRNNLFSSVSFNDSFQEAEKGVYYNRACRAGNASFQERTIFICQMDMGKLIVWEANR